LSRLSFVGPASARPRARRATQRHPPPAAAKTHTKSEVDALGFITISCGCFERCCSNKKTPPYHYNLSFVALRNRRRMLLRAPAYTRLEYATASSILIYQSYIVIIMIYDSSHAETSASCHSTNGNHTIRMLQQRVCIMSKL